MKTYTAEELALIIAQHIKWLSNEVGGEKANLSDAKLSNAEGRKLNTVLSVTGIGRMANGCHLVSIVDQDGIISDQLKRLIGIAIPTTV